MFPSKLSKMTGKQLMSTPNLRLQVQRKESVDFMRHCHLSLTKLPVIYSAANKFLSNTSTLANLRAENDITWCQTGWFMTVIPALGRWR